MATKPTNTGKKTAAKKTAAKKTAAKKTAANKAAATDAAAPKNTDAPAATNALDTAPDSPPISATEHVVIDDEITKVAEQVLRGSRRWGTGRERDLRLAKAGHDVEAVRREVYRLRGERFSKSS